MVVHGAGVAREDSSVGDSHDRRDGQKIKPRVYKSTPVRFIDIDDESLAKFGQWPWPRTVLAQLISILSEKGAAVIVELDLIEQIDSSVIMKKD